MSLHIVSDGRGGYRLDRDGWEIGWVQGSAIGFRGFESAVEARQAAGAACDALRVWLRRQRRTGLIAARGALRTRRDGAVTWLTLGGMSIGRIVERQERDQFGAGGYGFELYLPPPLELFRISAAQLIYAALERRAAARRLEVVRALA
jgi:hypothetical protein